LTETPLKIAVFIDFDNIEIGVKTTLNQQFDIAAILEGIKERGEVVTKVAYGDWKRAGDYGRLLSQHAIRMVQRNVTPGGDKNGADINLALDALEMAFTHHHINAFVIVGGDSDFITLVEKLKQYDKKVFVVGGRQFTSLVMQKNCHEFIAYENLVSGRRPAATERRSDVSPQSGPVDLAKAIPLVKRALKVLVDREVSPQLGLLKSTLLQLDSTFSERDYGASTFRDFIEKVAKTGIVTLRHAGRSMLVDLAEASSDATANGTAATPREDDVSPGNVVAAGNAATDTRPPVPALDPAHVQQAVQSVRELFERASQPPRWPMYMRQLKQYLRGNDPGFDERKWGFTSPIEFLRACQREGVLHIERDRKGIIRVFSGAKLPRPALEAEAGGGPAQANDIHEQPPTVDAIDEHEAAVQDEFQPIDQDLDVPGNLVDTTAEALSQAQGGSPPGARATRVHRARKIPAAAKPAARKAAGPKTAAPRTRREPR